MPSDTAPQKSQPSRSTQFGPWHWWTYLNTAVGMIVMLLLAVATVAYCPLIKGSSDRLEKIERILHGEFTQRYPEEGSIGTFTKSMRPITTSQDEQLSLLSDSSHRGTSTVYYSDSPVDPQQPEGNGCLQIHYHLTTACPAPFVGVYGNLANPVRMFDVSRFKGVEISCRWGSGDDGEQVAYLLLCDRNASEDKAYAWAEQQIPVRRSNDGKFQKLSLPFAAFETPAWRNLKIPLDTTQVFRFIIKIQPKLAKDCQGLLEIDEIRFY